MKRMLAAVAAAIAVGGATAMPASAAAPWLIVVSGDRIDKRIYLNDWNANLRIYSAVVGSPSRLAEEALGNRPCLDLALFWGDNGRGRPLHSLRPDDADQHGTFCPAYDGRPATIQLPLAEHPEPAVAPPVALELLAAAGVPVEVAARDDDRRWALAASAAAALAAVVIAIAVARRRK